MIHTDKKPVNLRVSDDETALCNESQLVFPEIPSELPKRTCACGCGLSMEGRRSFAKYYNDLHRVRAFQAKAAERARIHQTELERKFLTFHRRNPHVYKQLVNLALTMKRSGRKKCGIKALCEILRWSHALKTTGDDFKINNTFTKFYSRMILEQVKELDGFFEVRGK